MPQLMARPKRLSEKDQLIIKISELVTDLQCARYAGFLQLAKELEEKVKKLEENLNKLKS
jgi:hypothetical protein